MVFFLSQLHRHLSYRGANNSSANDTVGTCPLISVCFSEAEREREKERASEIERERECFRGAGRICSPTIEKFSITSKCSWKHQLQVKTVNRLNKRGPCTDLPINRFCSLGLVGHHVLWAQLQGGKDTSGRDSGQRSSESLARRLKDRSSDLSV